MKVLIATGGSGGHIFPALQLAQQMRQRGHQVLFAGVLGLAEDKILSSGFDLINIDAKGFSSKSIGSMFQFVYVTMKALGHAAHIVRGYKPDKVIGFGGYGSFPVIFASWMLKYPTMIHEQNVIPGKVNKLMGLLVKRIAISFKESLPFVNAAKAVWTGCPCHNELSAKDPAVILSQFGLSPTRRTLLLVGGSQGSQRLNTVVFEAMPLLVNEGWQLIHMTGLKEYELYVKSYRPTGWPVSVCAFISNIDEAYAVADVIVARAGASTISELGSLGLKSILVPYPFAGNHQEHNALVLTRTQTAVMIRQHELTAYELIKAAGALMERFPHRGDVSRLTREVIVADADIKLADALEQL